MKKWIYDNKNVLLIMVTSFFLVLVFIVGIHFFQEIEKAPDISKEPIVLPDQDELEFSNDSSMSVEEIWNLVEAKRKRCINFFMTVKFMNLMRLIQKRILFRIMMFMLYLIKIL